MLDSFPLTANAKIDRKALPTPDGSGLSRQEYEAPQGELEQTLATIWQELLQVEKVSRWDNFFDLGGHSLLAVQLVSRIETVFSKKITPRSVFDSPVLSDLAHTIDREDDYHSIAIVPVDREQPLSLSYAQKRLWLLDRIGGLGAAYHMPLKLALEGDVNLEKLDVALHEILRRHESLRTVFQEVDGEPVQVIRPPPQSSLSVVDVSEQTPEEQKTALLTIARQEAQAPFDLSADLMMRWKWVRQTPVRHVLFITMHHIASDGWSMPIVFKELKVLYERSVRGESSPLPALSIQYGDYAQWQAQRLQGAEFEASVSYWQQALTAAPGIHRLPTDYLRPNKQSYQGARVEQRLPVALQKQLHALARTSDSTLFIVLETVFALLLLKRSGEHDILIGSPTANRTHHSLEPLIGFFVNMLVLRTKIEGNPDFSTLLAQANRQSISAYENQSVPFDYLVDVLQPSRSLAHHPVFQIEFALQNTIQVQPHCSLGKVEVIASALNSESTKFDLSAHFRETETGLQGYWEYSTDLFEHTTVEQLAQDYESLLRRVVDQPRLSVNALCAPIDSVKADAFYIASTFTIEPIGPYLRTLGVAFKRKVDINFAPFNQVLQLLADPGSALYGGQAHKVLFIRWQDWAGDWSNAPIRLYENGSLFLRSLESVLEAVGVTVIECSVSAELGHNETAMGYVSELSQSLQRLGASSTGLTVLKMESINQLYALKDYAAAQLDKQASVPYQEVAYAALSVQLWRSYYSRVSPPRKVIVVDCDNTLWRGVCGEDAVAGVEIDAHYRGVQSFLLQQKQRGYVLALCSNNIAEDVDAVFATHPQMLLSKSDLVAEQIDCSPKSSNLKTIAEQLNVELDSLIFIDDDAVQCAEVQSRCAGVHVVHLPQDEASRVAYLSRSWLFDRADTGSTVAMDRTHLDNKAREDSNDSKESKEEFYRSVPTRLNTTEVHRLLNDLECLEESARIQGTAGSTLGAVSKAVRYVRPETLMETQLATIWSQVLAIPEGLIGRRHDFFALGGHSLQAVQLLAKIEQRLSRSLSIDAIFAHPVLSQLAERLETLETQAYVAIKSVDRDQPLPLSWSQQRLWFIAQLDEQASLAYHMPVSVRLTGELNQEALDQTLSTLLERHEVLRTTIVQNDAGEPSQAIHPETSFALSRVDLSGVNREEQGQRLAEIGQVEAQTSFDFEQGPLIRGQLIDLGVNEQDKPEYVLLATMHHIVSDGWSMGIFSREITALYAAYSSGKENPLAPLEIQYADYAHWQRSTLAEEGLGEQLSYWQGQLSDALELLTLPWDRARPAQQDYRGGYVGIHLGEELTEQLNTLAKSKGMTLYMVLLCAWGMLLSRLSGQETVVIATPVANRGRLELKDQIGFFVNILAIRIDIDPAKSLAAHLDEVREQTLNAYAHQDVPFDMVVEKIQPARSLSYGPVCQAAFTFDNGLYEDDIDLVDIALSDVALLDGTVHPNVQSQYDIALMLRELNSGEDAVIQGEVVYASALFDEQTIERWTEYLVRLLKGLVQEHRQAESVGLVPILSDAEQEVLVYRFNGTEAYYPKDKCIHELFEEQVAQNPHAIALVSEDKALSYDQLNKKANQFAHELVGLGVQPDSLVGFCLDRSAEAIVGLLGILKAGGAYLPLDPSYPEDRLRYMIEDSGISTLVTQLDLFVYLPVSDQQIICVDLEDAVSDQPTTNIPPENRRLSSSNLAYVMYTSGTTGRPKGTLIEHRAVVSLVVNNTYVPLTTTTRFLQGATLSFDAATLEVWGALLNGGQLAIFSNRYVSSKELGDFISTRSVNTAILTTGLFDQFVSTYAKPLDGLDYLIFGGEAANPSAVSSMKERNPKMSLINAYGPAENTTITTCYAVPKDWKEGEKLPIGSQINARKVYILDKSGIPSPVGVVGELYVGGAGIAREYLNLPELTAERFITNPFSEDPAERLYKTGDLGRWNKEGTIEFFGRNDSQVKIRGFRIELSEMESWLREQTGIDDVLVVVSGEGNAKQLVGYVTAEVEGDLQLGVIHSAIRVSLPEYMIPSELILLESFPLTANGKIDRKALPEPDGSGLSRPEYEAPEGETEQALATIWRNLLQVEQVGRGDNYFDLGGHSLLAVQLVSRIEQGLSRTLSLKTLFDRPVLSDLACELEDSVDHEYIAIERVDREQPLPLSWSQQRLWFIAQLDEQASLAYHMPVSVRLTGELNQAALDQTLSTLLERHEVLRTTFVQNEAGEPIQVIHSETSFALSRVDLSGVNRKEQGQRIADLEQVESETAFDLENGPLIRGRLIDLGINNEQEPEYVLLATMHHIVSDGWSMGIFSREITALYTAYLSGKENPLAPLEIQYADYAHWQRSTLAEEGLGEQLSYWQGQLSDVPELLTLPWDRARPAQQDYRGGSVDIQLGEELTKQLSALAQSKGMTLYMVLLSAWGMLLSRLSGQETVVVGTPVANRPREELEGLIGFFVNTLAIRLDVDTQSRSLSAIILMTSKRSHCSAPMIIRTCRLSRWWN